ncbi:MAG: selenium metabolism-associated LysR family transcriptional regulator [Nitrospirota bacterium]|nr:selenium metabolism-associated LysR family transcriptional regulator [Nitrospirota bacterium]
MDFRHIESFCKVADLKSFSRAAEELYLTQPSISGHILQLEKELGVKLFDRLGKEVALTAAGRCFLDYATRMMELREDAIQRIAELSGGARGTLVVGGSTIPAEYLLPSIIGRFKEGREQVSISLMVSDTAGIVEKLQTGEIEVGVIGAASDDPHLECRSLVSDRLALVVYPDHHFGASVSLKALAGEPCILRERGSGTRRFIEGLLRREGFSMGNLNVVAEMGSTAALKSAIKGRVGVSILSVRAVEEEVKAGSLRLVDIAGLDGMERMFYLVTSRTRTISPIGLQFVDFLLEWSKTAQR